MKLICNAHNGQIGYINIHTSFTINTSVSHLVHSEVKPCAVALSTSEFEFNVALHPQTNLRTIRDGEPRTATSTFTQLLNSGRQRQRQSSSPDSCLLHTEATSRLVSYLTFHDQGRTRTENR